MKNCILRIHGDFSYQLLDSLDLCLKSNSFGKRSVDVDGIKSLDARCVLGKTWRPSERVYKPRFAPDIARVKDGFPITFEHCGT